MLKNNKFNNSTTKINKNKVNRMINKAYKENKINKKPLTVSKMLAFMAKN